MTERLGDSERKTRGLGKLRKQKQSGRSSLQRNGDERSYTTLFIYVLTEIRQSERVISRNHQAAYVYSFVVAQASRFVGPTVATAKAPAIFTTDASVCGPSGATQSSKPCN